MFAKWLAADLDTRPISPLFVGDNPAIIDRRLKIGSKEAINEAFIANPLHPLVLIAQAGLEEVLFAQIVGQGHKGELAVAGEQRHPPDPRPVSG